jgi:hypothetical protein
MDPRNGINWQRSQKRSKKHNTKTYKQKHPKSHKTNTKHTRQDPKKRKYSKKQPTHQWIAS